jgi:hypothetical protein
LRRDEARFFLDAALFAVGFFLATFFAALAFRFGAARFFVTGGVFVAADVACPTAAAPLSSTLAKLLKTEPVAEMAAEPNVFASSPASRIPLFFAMHVPCRLGVYIIDDAILDLWRRNFNVTMCEFVTQQRNLYGSRPIATAGGDDENQPETPRTGVARGSLAPSLRATSLFARPAILRMAQTKP